MLGLEISLLCVWLKLVLTLRRVGKDVDDIDLFAFELTILDDIIALIDELPAGRGH